MWSKSFVLHEIFKHTGVLLTSEANFPCFYSWLNCKGTMIRNSKNPLGQKLSKIHFVTKQSIKFRNLIDCYMYVKYVL